MLIVIKTRTYQKIDNNFVFIVSTLKELGLFSFAAYMKFK